MCNISRGVCNVEFTKVALVLDGDGSGRISAGGEHSVSAAAPKRNIAEVSDLVGTTVLEVDHVISLAELGLNVESTDTSLNNSSSLVDSVRAEPAISLSSGWKLVLWLLGLLKALARGRVSDLSSKEAEIVTSTDAVGARKILIERDLSDILVVTECED